MATKKDKKEVEVKDKVIAETTAEVTAVEEIPVDSSVIEATGKFYIKPQNEGYVIINPNGQVVSKEMVQAKAEDMVLRYNRR